MIGCTFTYKAKCKFCHSDECMCILENRAYLCRNCIHSQLDKICLEIYGRFSVQWLWKHPSVEWLNKNCSLPSDVSKIVITYLSEWSDKQTLKKINSSEFLDMLPNAWQSFRMKIVYQAVTCDITCVITCDEDFGFSLSQWLFSLTHSEFGFHSKFLAFVLPSFWTMPDLLNIRQEQRNVAELTKKLEMRKIALKYLETKNEIYKAFQRWDGQENISTSNKRKRPSLQ